MSTMTPEFTAPPDSDVPRETADRPEQSDAQLRARQENMKKAQAARLAAKDAKKPRAPAKKRTPNRPAHGDLTDGLKNLLGMPAGILAMVGGITGQPALLADSFAVADRAEEIATAANDAARDDERLHALLERVTAMGSYGALISAMVPLALQILFNHASELPVPPAAQALLGIKSREQIIADGVAQQRRQAAELAEAEAHEQAFSEHLARKEGAEQDPE